MTNEVAATSESLVAAVVGASEGSGAGGEVVVDDVEEIHGGDVEVREGERRGWSGVHEVVEG